MASGNCREIVNEAKSKGLWIYDPTYKKWYTPEDFQHIFGHYAHASDPFLKQLQIRHPAEGIQAGFQRLMDIHNKLQAFTKQVLEYYKK
ncbi:MAG TPA: hypothetical protein VK369_01535 [Segetibacter sp.]|nr:hypothetical protein [Segetibacter sp.]